ncbi:hypothetical protein NQ314_006652 [Rhamnusium bicolor]|uniref:Uncharacterized protein n=1 Tax=Rhamnusium bicolor TaxID=1586634 RepID=A0AAV8YZZ4_9CUCU|nr:hypothetical protein NQ314_006652 [Rhamnusium bicolor]
MTNRGLHDAIEKLQNSSLSLVESLQIVNDRDVNTQLQAINDAKNNRVSEIFESVSQKDHDFSKLRQICDGAPTTSLSEFTDCFTYACITSVDLQRSFSKYKHIFSPMRT